MNNWIEDLHYIMARVEVTGRAFLKAHDARLDADQKLHAALLDFQDHCKKRPLEVSLSPVTQEKVETIFRVWLDDREVVVHEEDEMG